MVACCCCCFLNQLTSLSQSIPKAYLFFLFKVMSYFICYTQLVSLTVTLTVSDPAIFVTEFMKVAFHYVEATIWHNLYI